ncbi:MAG: DsbA family protein [Lactobacillales bacterium]|jgi:protein-disulfide isomerase|nr:DsbA family protein [Lactobacillales bacterium]
MKKIFLGLFAACMIISGVSFAAMPENLAPKDLRVFGHANAPAKIYVFSSFTCPYCAIYHKEVMPKLKEKYADTARAQIIFVELPYEIRAMTGTILSRCMPADKYEEFVNAIYSNQSLLMNTSNPRNFLSGYATALGMGEEDINRCLADKELQRTVMAQRDNLAKLYGVKGMPTTIVVVKGKPHLLEGADAKAILLKVEDLIGK